MMEETSIFMSFYDFVLYFLEPFAESLSDTQYQIMVSRVAETVFFLFVSGLISAVWGCFGALAALRRAKRG